MVETVSRRRKTVRVIGGAVVVLLFGALGVALVTCVALLALPPPASVSGRAWRTFALTLATTEVVAAGVGGVVGFVLGLSYPPTLWAAVLEGGLIAAVPGFVVGALVGGVLALDTTRQTGREVRAR